MGLIGKLDSYASEFLGKRLSQKEDSKAAFLDMFEQSRHEILIVAGELDPTFYCNGSFIQTLKYHLETNSRFTAKILFHKNPNKETTIAQLKKYHSQLVTLYTSGQFGERLQLYWAKKRPIFHFAIADSSLMLEEKNHKPESPREVYFRFHDDKLVKNYKEHFRKMADSSVVKELFPSDFS